MLLYLMRFILPASLHEGRRRLSPVWSGAGVQKNAPTVKDSPCGRMCDVHQRCFTAALPGNSTGYSPPVKRNPHSQVP